MPTIPTRKQQPIPVNPQVPIPGEFPAIPQEVLDRFPSAKDWQNRLNEFWGRTAQALQVAQQQTAAQVNSTVIWTVDRFLIYTANGGTMPMFALDDTGIRLGNVLVINTPGRKVYIGAGNYQSADTPFYIDTLGKFSLGANLTWNPDTTTLSITGTITATSGSIGGFDIGTDYIRDTANSMGLASTVTGGDDVRFWAGATFANRATAPFFVTEAGNLTANNATIVGTISGRSTATVAAAINAGGNLITDLINARLDTSTKDILSDFDFGSTNYAGALKAGTITWDTTTGAITGGSGVVVYRNGIVGAAAGVATFSIDATTGNATFAGTLSAAAGTLGAILLASGGYIRLGQTAYDTGTGFWLGDDAGTPKFSLGNSAGNKLTWNGATLAITGTITATTGSIGGFDIGSDYIRDAANSMGLASTVTVGDDVRFWAGAAFASRGTAPFRVTEAGVVTAASGTVGGWTLAATTITGTSTTLDSAGVLTLGTVNDVVILSAVDATYRIWVGNATAASAPFRVTKAGALTATSATITGTITATAGAIGGFDIGTDYVRDAANSFGLASTVTVGDDVRFWAGDTFANRATAPFRVTEAGNITANNATIVGTISGRSTATIAATINAAGNVITDLINARLDTSAKTMLSDFSFGAADYAGALKSGTITWNTTTGALTGGSGVLVFRGGIIGAAAGVATFTIDAATGAATFAGALSAPTGNIGGWTIGATTLTGGSATLDSAGVLTLGTTNDVVILSASDATYRLWIGNATAGSAPFRVTKAGALTATSGTIGGWTIGSSTLTGGSATLDSAGVLTLGTTNDVVILSASDATYRLWIGNATAASASFRVTKAGVLTATGATITGTITSTSGTIGGFTIGATAITAGSGASYVELASDVSGKPQNSALILGSTTGFRSTISNDSWWTYYDDNTSFPNLALDSGTDPTYAYCTLTIRKTNKSTGAATGDGVFLLGSTGDIQATGTVRADTAFNHNGTAGASGSFNPNAVTNITVNGGIITAWS